MCRRNYAELLEEDARLPLPFSPSLFALSNVFFNKRVKQDSTTTLREAVNHSKSEATNNSCHRLAFWTTSTNVGKDKIKLPRTLG